MSAARTLEWKARILALLAALAVASCATAQDEWAKRDAWQRPAEVMDAMGAAAGSVVADIGAGRGYFTFRLAERVGPQGKVYAVEIEDNLLEQIRSRAKREGVQQIETIRGTTDDPRLPASALDAILVVNAYHEMRHYNAMLQGMLRALKPGGRLVVLDQSAKAGRDRDVYFREHHLPEEIVREDALRNGLHFLNKRDAIRVAAGETWYFLVFEKPRS
jgi:ubiquinone/menaquinone biosynthesis C-methylase UbiE